MIDELLNNIQPDVLRKVTSLRSYARDIISEARYQLGGEFPKGKKVAITKAIPFSDTLRMIETKQAFEVLKRYLRRKYSRLHYEEYIGGYEVRFCISFYTDKED